MRFLRTYVGLFLVVLVLLEITTGSVATEPVAEQTTDPFTNPVLSGFLAGRNDDVTAALYNVYTGTTDLYRPGVAEITASVVKVDILETLLHEDQVAKRSLSAAQLDLATAMVEESDNDAAEDLWEAEGSAPAVSAYDRLIGLHATTPNSAWGETTTTADDQVHLLDELLVPSSPLSGSARALELNLMEHVDSDQHWGISAGTPAGATVALKNGWLPDDSGQWQVNSIGYVSYGDASYLLAIFTSGNADEQYGISTIEDTARLVWGSVHLAAGLVAPRPPNPAVGMSAKPRAIPSGGAVVRLIARSAHATRCEVSATPTLPRLPRTVPCASGRRVITLEVPPNPSHGGRRIVVGVNAVGPGGAAATSITLHQNG